MELIKECDVKKKLCPFKFGNPDFSYKEGMRCDGNQCIAWVNYTIDKEDNYKGYCELIAEEIN